MTDIFKTIDKLAAKGMTYLGMAGPGRLVAQNGADLVALTKDGKKELWRHALPSQEAGWVKADEHTILWDARRERRFLVAVAAADGRQLYVLEGEWACVLDGDRFLARNGDGTSSLRRTESGELIASLPGLSESEPYLVSPDRRLLLAGFSPAQVWDLEEFKLRFSFDSNYTDEVLFTPDSAKLVTKSIMTPQSGMEDEITVRTYDVRTGALIDEKSWWERQ